MSKKIKYDDTQRSISLSTSIPKPGADVFLTGFGVQSVSFSNYKINLNNNLKILDWTDWRSDIAGARGKRDPGGEHQEVQNRLLLREY